MAKYFHVEGGGIVQGPRALPRSFKNISGFHHLDGDLATLKGHGWLPEELVGYEPFDQTTQVREGPVFEVMATKVKSVYTIRDKTKDELTDDVRQHRAIEYAPLGDQLDMMYHDLLDGTSTWQDHVAAVKAANPKPE